MSEDITEDWLLNEQVRIFQPKKGYRAGLDAILLAASLPDRLGMQALELGCGAGGALFPAATRLKNTSFIGLERETEMAALARKGVSANALDDRVQVIEGDVHNLPSDWENRYDLVFSNPPYFEPGKIQAPSSGRHHAYMAEQPLTDWLKAMLFVTKPKGRITLIHRAGEVGEILSYLLSRSGEIEVYPVRSAPGLPAKRVIVTARKGLRRGEVTLHDGLTMHEGRGARDYTEAAAAILSGAPLSWA